MKSGASLEVIVDQIIREGRALSIRDVDCGEDPFVYSTEITDQDI